MEQHEQLEQLRKDRVSLHLTIRECAELTNTSESTAKRVFSSNRGFLCGDLPEIYPCGA